MTYADRPVGEFVADLADGGVTPGGGGGAAVAGAVGTALVEMVCANTVGRADAAGVAEELSAIGDDLEDLRTRLLELADEDAEAVEALMAAYGTEGEGREAAIQGATVDATAVPLEIAETARDALDLATTVTERGNRNAVADGGIGAHLLRAVVGAAVFTVRLNVETIDDEAVAADLAERADAAEAEAEAALAAVEATLAETY